ncbi:bifunctional protein-disulfide isomerase/oxidoreductase DsbC [Gallaecimonas sp. GXIMD4217]|uniref:bifunctional protein-disulfide isomerase/oxidoreductase DsbC n=1 Tax=Gallaecimonas sp. GXIMD4217 TaxID=3131927 RepID=UPI00311ADBC9
MKKFTAGIVASLVALSTAAWAGEDPIKEKLEASLGVQVDTIAETPVKGLYEVVAANNVLYASADGNYVLSGNLFSLKDGAPESLTEVRKNELRLSGVEKLKDSMIVFPAKDPKHTVTVFTDVDCGYCQKLHKEMADYNDKGITVRYLAYPRAGLNSGSSKKLDAVWCAEDPKEAMTLAKNRKPVDSAPMACDSPVADHFRLGRQFQLSGTPALVLDDGSLVPGYLPAERLAAALESQ